MGAWDAGAFGNDDAMDWAAGLAASDDLAPIRDAFAAADADYLEGPAGSAIIAAAATLLAMSGDFGQTLPPDVSAWVAAHGGLDSRLLVSAGVSALDRVLASDSELLELWSGSDDAGSEWRASVDRLRSGLDSGPAAPSVQTISRLWWKFWG